MGKKIFGIYLAKLDAPNSEAHARLELPASPWELHDAMDKVQLQENEELYLEIDDYYGFEYLAPHLMELDASLNELNDLAGRLAVLDETEQEAFDGLLRLEIQRKVESNGSILTMQDLRTLAVSAGADCCHVVGATSDAELGRFYAENGFMEELDGLSDDVFEMLDFGKIGKALRTGENGTFTRSGYVVKHSELVTAPPCAKELPEKPEYLFRLTLGLHPDLEDDRTVTLELPASAEALREVPPGRRTPGTARRSRRCGRTSLPCRCPRPLHGCQSASAAAERRPAPPEAYPGSVRWGPAPPGPGKSFGCCGRTFPFPA